MQVTGTGMTDHSGQQSRIDGMNSELASSDRFLDIFLHTIAMTSRLLDHPEVMETLVRALPALLNADACTLRYHRFRELADA